MIPQWFARNFLKGICLASTRRNHSSLPGRSLGPCEAADLVSTNVSYTHICNSLDLSGGFSLLVMTRPQPVMTGMVLEL